MAAQTLRQRLFALCLCMALSLLVALGLPCVGFADEKNAENAANTSAASDAQNTSGATNQNDNKAENKTSEHSGQLIDLGDENYVNTQQLPDSSFIYDTSIEDLSTADSYMEGQTVQVVGEVIGDCIQAEFDGNHCWLSLADGQGSTIAAYVSKDMANLVDTYGRYGQTGTKLQVRGKFNLTCSQHQGQTDIHVEHASVISKGKTDRKPFSVQDFIPGLGMVLVGLLLFLLYNIVRERMR